MPHLDRLTTEEIIKKFEEGKIAEAKAEVMGLAPKYPSDEALQRANALLAEDKADEACEVLKEALATKLRGFQAGGLPFDDIRGKEPKKLEGR